jgi:hypothetical protein
LKYYRLVYSGEEKDKKAGIPTEKLIVVNKYDLNGFDLRDLWKGKKIENWNEEIKLYYEEGEKALDYVPNVMSWLIFSDKLIEVLNDCRITGIQVLPVRIYKTGCDHEYFKSNVVNVLNVQASMDWGKSDYIPWDDNPMDIHVIRHLVMNRSNIDENIDLFHLAEKLNYLIISERLKDEIELRGITGCGYREIDLV